MKHLIRSILIAIIVFFTSIFGRKNKARIKRLVSSALSLMNVLNEEILLKDGNCLTFHCPNDLTRWRAQTFFEKEPETLEWIDGFFANDVFWDIGANMGLYTLYTASKGTRVLAFEPSGANFYALNMSLLKSNLSNTAIAYCLAFTDRKGIAELLMQDYEFGGAHSSFETAIGFDGEGFVPSAKQGMIGYSIDGYISTFDPPFPNHIKIDVDGIEDKIITGAQKTLLDNRLKSLSVELDAGRPDYTEAIIKQIVDSGLSFQSKRHAEMFDDSPFSRIYNYQFKRI